MAKLKKKEAIVLPKEDWQIEPWNSYLYQKHTEDFKEIQKEYRVIAEKCPSAIMCCWYWLQSKGAVKIEWKYSPTAKKDYPDFILYDSYLKYAALFLRYCKWTSFEEKKLSEQTGISLEQMRKEVTEQLNKNINERMKCFTEPIDFKIQDDFDSLIADANSKL